MSYYPAWAVAAAILVIEEAAFPYKLLAKRVRQTGLSGLGRKSGRNTSNIMGTRLREHPGVIIANGRGYYETNDEAAMEHLQVQGCVTNLMEEKFKRYNQLLGQMVGHTPPTPEEVTEFQTLKKLVDRIVGLFEQQRRKSGKAA